MSQGDLADAAGISRRSISSYENGERTPSRPQVLAWAMVTGVPIKWLIDGSTNPHPDGPGGGYVLPRLDSNQQPSGYPFAQVIGLFDPRLEEMAA